VSEKYVDHVAVFVVGIIVQNNMPTCAKEMLFFSNFYFVHCFSSLSRVCSNDCIL